MAEIIRTRVIVEVVLSGLASVTECEWPSWFGFYDPATNTTRKIISHVAGAEAARDEPMASPTPVRSPNPN